MNAKLATHLSTSASTHFLIPNELVWNYFPWIYICYRWVGLGFTEAHCNCKIKKTNKKSRINYHYASRGFGTKNWSSDYINHRHAVLSLLYPKFNSFWTFGKSSIIWNLKSGSWMNRCWGLFFTSNFGWNSDENLLLQVRDFNRIPGKWTIFLAHRKHVKNQRPEEKTLQNET